MPRGEWDQARHLVDVYLVNLGHTYCGWIAQKYLWNISYATHIHI